MPKLLILSSNPRRDLDLEREVSDLVAVIQRLGTLEFRLGLGVRSQELREFLTEHTADIVHFCGHGAGEKGLILQGDDGQEQIVSTEVLTRLFEVFAKEINCLVLNACDSDRQAEAIVEHINYVIGISQPILDKAAYFFATGFYQGLATGKSIEQSYELGCVAIQIWSETELQAGRSRKFNMIGESQQTAQSKLPEHRKPVLLKRSLHYVSSPPTSEQVISELTDVPPQFVANVQEEVDRKDYKDQARSAYDNFGQYSAQGKSALSKSEYKQRQILVRKVKEFWIEGFLRPSLQGIEAIRLDLKTRPEAIADLTQGIEKLNVELDQSYDQLKGTQIYKERGQGRTLLILGEPGSGKTIALLQLAEKLINRSEQDLSLPIPIVFNLSSWAPEQKPIVDWLIDELREKYQVPKSLSEPWIQQQQLILLLDGLDEVNKEYRNSCVQALNEFIGSFPHIEVAVCSRIHDYNQLHERLKISSALCLQPLSTIQIYEFLDGVGESLIGLKTLLISNAELEQLARTPLILNFMSVSYQKWPVEQLRQKLVFVSDPIETLFNTYIEYRLAQYKISKYNKDKIIRWLSWLARQMAREKQTIFLIEKIQPTWLKNINEERRYRTIVFVVSGLMFGFVVWLIAGALYGPIEGLVGGFIAGLINVFPKRIYPLEKLSWSWQRAKSRVIHEFSTGIGYGLIYGLVYGLIDILVNGSINQLANVWLYELIYAPIFGLVFGLGSGLGGSKIIQRTVPNQGIRTSLRNCLVVGSIGGLAAGLIFGLIDTVRYGSTVMSILLVFGATVGVIVGLKYGGSACIQHATLRQILYHKNRIPWNYAKFLDFASACFLTKKVGGGYVFFHRMLLEHFAQMNQSATSISITPVLTSQSTIKTHPQDEPSLYCTVNNKTERKPSVPTRNYINCPTCNHSNPSNGKFCIRCGSQLT